jgi:hypothetical protein
MFLVIEPLGVWIDARGFPFVCVDVNESPLEWLG